MIQKVDEYFLNLSKFGAAHYHGRDEVERRKGASCMYVGHLHTYYAKFGYISRLVSF